MSQPRHASRSPTLPPDGLPMERIDPESAAVLLKAFIARHPRLLVLTGAGVSTDSGIPDYRDLDGAWKRKQPVEHQVFMSRPDQRQRYWGRSLIGWPAIRNARPNRAHECLAVLERKGHSRLLLTQNVDRLHQRAGSRQVLDLHGRADQVICMQCDYRCERDEVHERCLNLNPAFDRFSAAAGPDGDADLDVDFSHFQVADCPLCGGILKPDVVFFGDAVPRDRVESGRSALEASDGLLVVGSSLMVLSGFRFCRFAHQLGKPVATLNLGRTRADSLSHLRLNAPIAPTLASVVAQF